MTNITLASALEIVKGLTFDNVPAGWALDYKRMAKAYRAYRKRVSHEAAVEFIGFYLHHYRVCDTIDA